jgi:hypothetical protein
MLIAANEVGKAMGGDTIGCAGAMRSESSDCRGAAGIPFWPGWRLSEQRQMAGWNYSHRVRPPSVTGLVFGICYFLLVLSTFSKGLLEDDLHCISYIIGICPLELVFAIISMPAWPVLFLAAGVVLLLRAVAEYSEWEWLLVQMDGILRRPYEYVPVWMIVMIAGSFVMYVLGWAIEVLVRRASRGARAAIRSRSGRRR